jgi:general secretion pathway protein D
LENETRSFGVGAIVNRRSLALAILVTALGMPAYADRGNDAYKRGVRAEHQGDFDAASAYYKQACTFTPSNPRYLSAYTRIRFNAAEQHVHSGQLLRNTGALTEALAQFQRAVEIDTSSFIAQQELRRTADMIRRQERQRSAPKSHG